jgi:murein DD-endopeptidase MepM/ murein hydrolase activator NlpD
MNLKNLTSFARLSLIGLTLISLVTLEIGGGYLAFATTGDTQSGDTTSFVGIKKSRSSAIIDSFKEQQKELLFINSPFTPDEEKWLFESEIATQNLEQMMSRINESKNALKEQKQTITTRKFTLQGMIADIDESMSANLAKIADTEEAIRLKNRDIIRKLREIVELQNRIDANKDTILSYLAYMYGKGDLVYGEDNSIDIIRTLVFTEGNISDVLANYHFLTLLEVTGQNFLEERRTLLGEYYTESQSLKEDKVTLATNKASLVEYRASLESQKLYKEELLERTRGQEALYNEYIADRQEKQDRVEARLAEASALYDGAFTTVAERSGCIVTNTGLIVSKSGQVNVKCDELQLSYNSEKKLREFSQDELPVNPLKWPVAASYISAYYHDADYFASIGSSHEAIDIPAPQGSEIRAPMAGYVYFVNEPTKNGYGYVALKHPNGLMTVYGHVSEIRVKKFEFVEAGAVFALSGGAPGTPGAGVMTSGAHLHLEVWQNRETVDPLRFLDLTELRFESLSTKYKYKFIEDLKLRYGYMANTSKFDTFRLTGDSEIDRQKNLLANYATSDFNRWDIWTEEAVEAKVDPSFMMCVGLAETGLGRNLKTQYNVGNIGNTDSGATSEFISPRDGIYWMGKTFNNKYLGEYQAISDLSRWGNKTGAIYASSPKNWQENIVRCLSALKGRFVEDSYRFRLAPIDSSAIAVERAWVADIRTPNTP